ncbi:MULTISPECIES: response regulator [unclassified Streptomyces]|uniref:response regulator n=1 Tax=unclassified Streptomyces TaxID=2593676 RepID=UPI003653CA1F
MTRVLVVEDDPQLVRALRINLQARRFEVEEAGYGGSALRLAAARKPDVMVLDFGLPDMDGIDVIKGVRGWSKVPTLVLSARHTSEDKIRALDAGAGADDVSVVTTVEFTIDLAAKKVRRGERGVRLTPTEWHLLEILTARPGRLITEPGMGYRFEP